MDPTTQRIFPFLYVDDVVAYLRFLTKAFGFETRVHEVDPTDGEHEHAETALGGAAVMISRASPKWGSTAARKLPALHSAIYIVVDDVDVHCRRARTAGAIIKAEPEDMPWGARMYTARDPEGNEWYIATPVRA